MNTAKARAKRADALLTCKRRVCIAHSLATSGEGEPGAS